MKVAELREMSVGELEQKETDLRREFLNLRVQQATGEIVNPKRMGHVRRDIARILTVLREKAERNG